MSGLLIELQYQPKLNFWK